jgi:glycosyltransferase involved in cell wall biosynthesis
MITYNHENYISKAIESVLMQKTLFPIELIISDDCSSDNTHNIIKEYTKKNPTIIRDNSPRKNLGIMSNFIKTLKTCSGKYIALCEGDDYWTDPYKLQKQVDFLEANSEFSFCFHKVNWINENENLINNQKAAGTINYYSPKQIFDIKVPIPSLVMRNNILSFPKEFFIVPHGDPFLYAMLATKGNFADLGFVGANRRIHPGGVYCGESITQRYLNTIKTRRIMLSSDYFPSKIKKLIQNQLKRKRLKYLWKLTKKLDISGFFKILFALI